MYRLRSALLIVLLFSHPQQNLKTLTYLTSRNSGSISLPRCHADGSGNTTPGDAVADLTRAALGQT